MRRLVAWLAAVGLLGTVVGCHKGRGVCDCMNCHEPCCYGSFLDSTFDYYHGPPMPHAGVSMPHNGAAMPHPGVSMPHNGVPLHAHIVPGPVAPVPAVTPETLKVVPKEIDKGQPPKNLGKETPPPPLQ